MGWRERLQKVYFDKNYGNNLQKKLFGDIPKEYIIQFNDYKLTRCEGAEDYERTELIAKANAATRAACDMRTVIRKMDPSLIYDLTKETREWIKQHDIEDAKRIKEEDAAGIRQKIKQQALDKLSLEERRVLGL